MNLFLFFIKMNFVSNFFTRDFFMQLTFRQTRVRIRIVEVSLGFIDNLFCIYPLWYALASQSSSNKFKDSLLSEITQSSWAPIQQFFMLMIPNCTFLSLLQTQLLHLKCSPILSLTYSPGWTLTNCFSIHPKLNSYSLVQNNNGSNFLNSQLYLSAMISSQSALLLVILASSSILICHSQIKLTPCLSLVIFISETSVVFVISFLFLQLQRLPIHSSPANLIVVIHSTMAFRKLTWTKYSAYKILWLVSLQIHQNLNTLHQYSKNYIGFQSNNASITNCAFLHIKRFKFSNLPIFTILLFIVFLVFLFLLTLCLQDHLIHRFCPSHMSEHLWVKGPFLSLLQDSGTPSRLTPVTRYLFLHSAKNSKPIFSS